MWFKKFHHFFFFWSWLSGFYHLFWILNWKNSNSNSDNDDDDDNDFFLSIHQFFVNICEKNVMSDVHLQLEKKFILIYLYRSFFKVFPSDNMSFIIGFIGYILWYNFFLLFHFQDINGNNIVDHHRNYHWWSMKKKIPVSVRVLIKENISSKTIIMMVMMEIFVSQFRFVFAFNPFFTFPEKNHKQGKNEMNIQCIHVNTFFQCVCVCVCQCWL